MIKVTDKNRSFVFLAATMIIGVLIIGVLMFIENSEIITDLGPETTPPETNSKDLENKIENLKKLEFDPTIYNTLVTEINTSYQQELITSTAKNYLISKLTTEYSDLVYKKSESFLMGDNLYTSIEILSWLKQVENLSSLNDNINYYRNQIKAYIYYSETLPIKIQNFISPGITNYNDTDYYNYKSELEEMPNLAPKYKRQQMFIVIKSKLLNDLAQFNADYNSPY